MERQGQVRTVDNLDRWVERVKTSPQFRSAVTRIVNREGAKVVKIAEEIAEEELHRRDDPTRRSVISREHGKHLHDSFYLVPAKENDYKPVIRIGNDHPAYGYIDRGTPRHSIPVSVRRLQVFPWNGPVGRNESLGTKGSFPVDWADGNKHFTQVVDHPGNRPHTILARALRRYRRRSQKHRIS